SPHAEVPSSRAVTNHCNSVRWADESCPHSVLARKRVIRGAAIDLYEVYLKVQEAVQRGRSPPWRPLRLEHNDGPFLDRDRSRGSSPPQDIDNCLHRLAFVLAHLASVNRVADGELEPRNGERTIERDQR